MKKHLTKNMSVKSACSWKPIASPHERRHIASRSDKKNFLVTTVRRRDLDYEGVRRESIGGFSKCTSTVVENLWMGRLCDFASTRQSSQWACVTGLTSTYEPNMAFQLYCSHSVRSLSILIPQNYIQRFSLLLWMEDASTEI